MADRCSRVPATAPAQTPRGFAPNPHRRRNPAVTWWVVQTESQREHIVRLLLMRNGFTTYAPRIKHRGRIGWLFPTYVFVRTWSRFYPILWTTGVVRLLMCGEQPASLADDIIANIRKREIGGFVKLPPPTRL